MLNYQLQNMANLWFYLLDTDDVPDAIQILKQRRLHCPHYQLDLRIIGSSHIISWRTASTKLTECLTCLPIKDIKAKVLMECSLPLNGDEFMTTVENIRYTIKFNTIWFERGEYQKQHHFLLDNITNETLYYEFPVCEETESLNPLTLLKYSCQEKLVQIWTYHTYPDECGIVDTHTKIEIFY